MTKRAHLPCGDVVVVPRDRTHRGEFERFILLERRQDAGQAAGEHRLARAGRTAQQKIVRADGCDLERAARLRLAAHVDEIGNVHIDACRYRRRARGRK